MSKKKSQAPRGRRRRGDPPPYLRHSSGQGYATLEGKALYFGLYESPEARDKYERFRLGWLSQNCPSVAFAKPGRSLAAILPDYLREIEPAMGKKEYGDVKRNLETVTNRFGGLRPDEFRAAQYKAVREEWLKSGHVRHTIAKACGRLKRWFSWMVEMEYANPETHGLLLRIRNLRKGQAPDRDPILPVPMRDYVRTRHELSPVIRAMCRVMLFGGPRPGEVCAMRMSEITMKKGVWIFRPTKASRVQERDWAGKKDGPTIHYFGPRVQAVLAPYMRDDDEPLFQPIEARAARYAEMRAKRKTKVQPSQASRAKKVPGRPPGKTFDTASFRRAIVRAALRAGAKKWHPHQLRHLFGTRLRRRGVDLLTVSVLLAHESPDVTLIYAEEDLVKATQAAAKHG